DLVASLHCDAGAAGHDAAQAAIPARDAPLPLIPAEHRLEDRGLRIIDIFESREEIEHLSIVGIRLRRHGPYRDERPISFFGGAGGDAGGIYPAIDHARRGSLRTGGGDSASQVVRIPADGGFGVRVAVRMLHAPIR